MAFWLDEPEPVEDVELLPQRLPMRILYDCMDKVGLSFGQPFQCPSDVLTSIVQGFASGNLAGLELDDDKEYHLHPAGIDVLFQLISKVSFRGLSNPVSTEECRPISTV